MVLFSDGEDTRVQVGDRTLDQILEASIANKIPVYMVRTNYEREKGKVIPDEIWVPAIEKTGGRFYAADSEDALLAAIADIDKVAAGTIATRQVHEPASALRVLRADGDRLLARRSRVEARAATVPEAALGEHR